MSISADRCCATAHPVEPGHRAVWMSIETAAGLVANDGDRNFLRNLSR